MKRTFAVFLLVASLVGGATWYGFSGRGGSGALSPENEEKLVLAEQLIRNGEGSKALKIIDGLQEEGVTLNEDGELTHVRALEAAGRYDAAAEAATAFLTKYPSSEYKVDAEVIRLSSELARSAMLNPTLRKSVEDFVNANPSHKATPRLEIALAKQDLELGDHAAAQRRLDTALQQTENFEVAFDLASALGRANLAKLFSPALNDGDTEYTVKSGNTINVIARNHGVTDELLMNVNGISDPRKLRVGQKLKIPNVDFSLHVDVAANTMELRNHGELFKIYRVRTGREKGTTPVGTFKVLNKKGAPTWRPGNGYVYKPGDPNNELGTRWMAFEGDILGIHGTLHPETIGHYASNGCVALSKEDVEELFDLITVGTPLHIKGEQDTTRNRIIPAPNVPPPLEMASN